MKIIIRERWVTMYNFYETQKRYPSCPRGSFSYVIKSGDTLYKLAITYDTTVEAIMRINPGVNPNNLQIGQRICIPEGVTPPVKCPRGTFAYTIKSGDTLYKLAIEYNTTVEAIMRVNPGINPDNLQIGQRICIPRGITPPPECDGILYTVKPGDTMYGIARMFNIPVEELLRANPGVDPNNLSVGQKICIPRKVTVCPGGTIYTVRENDTVGTILLRFNISYMDLTSANIDVDFDMLMAGQQICILPHEDMGCACGMGLRSYKITRNDVPQTGPVVVEIARKFNMSVEELMMANPTFTPSHFELGQVVCVPK